jgi:hypothetical protein
MCTKQYLTALWIIQHPVSFQLFRKGRPYMLESRMYIISSKGTFEVQLYHFIIEQLLRHIHLGCSYARFG